MDYLFMFIYVFVMAGILWIYHWHATLIVECVGCVFFLGSLKVGNRFAYIFYMQKKCCLLSGWA